MKTSQKRKICFITGTRADYGILFPVMKAVESSPKLKLCIIATGMHLQKEYGETVKEIKKDGFQISAAVSITSAGDESRKMAQAVGQAILKFTDIFSKLCPDIVIVLGDRGEMLAGAIAANYLNIPVAHIHGGGKSGHVDGIVRHAITKLAHLHFAATNQAKARILRMGEEPWRIFTSGAPALDRILHERLPSAQELLSKYHLQSRQKLIILIQHPVLTEAGQAGKQIEATLKAIASFKIQAIIIYPNTDAGGKKMIQVIEKYQNLPFIKIFKSLPHRDYLGLLKIASVLVGNSSSGMIEAASFKIPVINIGTRQNNRERAANVIDVAYDRKKIIQGLQKVLSGDKLFMAKLADLKNPYDQGNASERILKVLQTIKFDQKLLNKKMTY